MGRKVIVRAAAFVALSLLASIAEAAILRVVVVEVSDAAGYVQELEKGRALLKKGGSPAQVRAWRARFAGPNAGQYVVSIEYPDLQTFAVDDKRMAADAEYQAWLKGLDKLRKVVSDSLYEEARP